VIRHGQKRVVTKDQDTSQPAAHLAATAKTFNIALAHCCEGVEPDAVHRLRTGARRLQAMLEACLREEPGAGLEEPARAWMHQLKQLRRAAGPVRDLDVHLKLLKDWIGSPRPTAEEEKLDTWLKDERHRLAQRMQKEIRKKQRGLAERQAAFLTALDRKRRIRSPRPADTVALEAFVRAADAMPMLDAENLHDFRKATKKARYIAESGAGKEVATALKRIQDAIGEWHDWLCLSQEAKSALGEDAPGLTQAFDREVELRFAAGLKITQTVRARLTGEWMASQGKRAGSVVTARRLAS
jgi:CHAD domain-containing protein